jgi:hypothetical protein
MDDAIGRIDQRFDDVDRRFDAVDRRFDEMRAEMRDMRVEFRDEIRLLRGDLNAMHRQQALIGWGIAGALLAQLVTFVITQS